MQMTYSIKEKSTSLQSASPKRQISPQVADNAKKMPRDTHVKNRSLNQ